MDYIDLLPDKVLNADSFGRIIHENTYLYNDSELQILYSLWLIEYEKHLKNLKGDK